MGTRTLRHTAVLVLALLSAAAMAQASVWTGGSGNWSSNASPGWNGTGVPDAVGATADFTGAVAGTTTQDAANVTVGTISLGGAPGARTVATGANVITLDQDGAGAGTATISNSTTQRLTITGKLTLADDLLVSHTGSVGGSVKIYVQATISGNGNITVSNNNMSTTAGKIYLTGLNGSSTFTGNVLVQKGMLTWTENSTARGLGAATNVVTVGSAGNGDAGLYAAGSCPAPNPIIIAAGTGGTTTISALIKSTYSGTVTLNGDLTVAPLGTLATQWIEFSNVVSGAGGLTQNGPGRTVLSGDNTYTGNTTVSQGTLTLASTGELRFKIQDANASNRLLGSGTANLDGLFRLDVSALTDTTGTWNLVNVGTLAETFGGTFNLAFVGGATFTDQGGGTYTSGNWTFTTSDGNLTLIPEPATMALLALGGVGVLLRRRR